MSKVLFYLSIMTVAGLTTACNNDSKKSHSIDDNEIDVPQLQGGVSSNGGASLLDAHNPWFVGAEPVSYCLDVGEHFSATQNDLEALVRESLDDWTTTIKTLKGDQRFHEFPDGIRRAMSTNFMAEESCNHETKLRFAFGTPREPSWGPGENRIGETLRKPINLQNGDTSGIVWISPDLGPERLIEDCDSYWSELELNPLTNILRHELGHVFGLSHDSMDFYHFMNEIAPGQILAWLARKCRSDDFAWAGEKVSSALFVDRLSFFTGKEHLGVVVDNGTWLRDHLGMESCDNYNRSNPVMVSSQTLTNDGRDLSKLGADEHKRIFKSGDIKVDFNFTCDDRLATAQFIPDMASRYNYKPLVTASYLLEHDSNYVFPDAEYVVAVGQYGASGKLKLKDGSQLPVFLEARSGDDRFLRLTFQGEEMPFIEILLRRRQVYGFIHILHHIE